MTSRWFGLALSLSMFAAVPGFSRLSAEDDQTPIRPLPPSATRPYMDGTVWVVDFLRTREGSTDRLLERLAYDWRSMLEQARGEGLIVSYRVLHGMPAHQRDWDVMTLIELRNMAALDGFNQRLGEIGANPIGPRLSRSVDFSDVREVVGTRIVREIVLLAPR